MNSRVMAPYAYRRRAIGHESRERTGLRGRGRLRTPIFLLAAEATAKSDSVNRAASHEADACSLLAAINSCLSAEIQERQRDAARYLALADRRKPPIERAHRDVT